MILSSIKQSLGSLIILGLLIACTSEAKVESRRGFLISTDTCKADLIEGRILVGKLSCTNCHLVLDEAPRMRKNIPLLREISMMDSLKLSSYIFDTKHNGMFIKDYPDSKKILDSLSECDKSNLTHYLKEHNREQVRASSEL
ncbi:MAG: hypothetical protein MUP99_03135 [Pedobacter sp.]|nr:hypothetical protein [Pedobacter sp.]